MENKLQNLKFRVYSEEHSKAIQEKLFSMDEDINWITGERDIFFDKSKYLFLEGKELHVDNNDYLDSKYTLCTLDDLYKMESEPKDEILQ